MADEIWIKHNLGTFQQPYIFQQNRSKQSPTTGQAVAQQPAIARQPSTYQKQSPYSYRDPVSYQEPNIRNAQNPVIRSKQSPYIADAQNPFIRNAQTAFTYNHRSPGTYRVPVDYQTPFTYNYRSPGTYRSPVNYRLPFTYQYRSPGTYRSSVSKQSPFTYNVQTTVPYSYRSPYIFNMWGSPGGISTNLSTTFNRDVENLNQNDVQVATRLNVNHNVSTKTITFFFVATVHGGSGQSTVYTTNSATVTYTGTLSNLEARFVFNSISISLDDDAGDGYAKFAQAFATNAQLNAGSISGSNPLSVAGATTVNDLSSNEGGNQTFNGAWGNLGVDNNQNKSAMLYVSAEPRNSLSVSAFASISLGTNSSLVAVNTTGPSSCCVIRITQLLIGMPVCSSNMIA